MGGLSVYPGKGDTGPQGPQGIQGIQGLQGVQGIQGLTGLSQMIHVRDEKASGTDAGTAVGGLQTRTLQTVKSNTIAGASLAANKITLPAGTYRIWGSVPAYRCAAMFAVLRNVTDAVTAAEGTTEYSPVASTVQVRSQFSGQRFTIVAAKEFDIRQYFGVASGGAHDMGVAAVGGVVEVFTDIVIMKE